MSTSNPPHQDLRSNDQQLIAELKKENAKLQKRIAQVEVKNISLHNKIKALEKELEQRPNRSLLKEALSKMPGMDNQRQTKKHK